MRKKSRDQPGFRNSETADLKNGLVSDLVCGNGFEAASWCLRSLIFDESSSSYSFLGCQLSYFFMGTVKQFLSYSPTAQYMCGTSFDLLS